MEGAEKPPGPDLPPMVTAMKIQDYILLILACVAVVALFYVVVTVSAFASDNFGPLAGILFIVAVCVVALLILAIIKKETDGMDRN